MPKSLFDSDEESSDGIKINKKYASDYQSRKQKEELRHVRFNEGVDDDDDSSTSSTEDEDGELLTAQVEASVFKTINALRSKSAEIYDSKVQFFDPIEQPEVDEDAATGKKPKPKRYKDVVREQVLEQMKETRKEEVASEKRDRLAYDEEQQNLRQAFLESTRDDSDEDDLLAIKQRSTAAKDSGREKAMEELEAYEKSLKDTDRLVDPKGEVEDGQRFLLDYFKKRTWVEKDEIDEMSDGDQKKSAQRDDGNDSDDSLEALDKMDDFEAKYNFRFEEAEANTKSGADLSLMTYARGQTMNTLRRKDETRREKRLTRKERKAAERKEKEEQLKRLKNAKRQEMTEKLNEIKTVLGQTEESAVDEATIMKLLEGDFDPDKFESLMNQTYGDDYYQQEDSEWKTDTDVRESLRTDEDGTMLVGEEDPDGALYDNVDEEEVEPEDDEPEEGYEEEDDYLAADEAGLEPDEDTELEKKIKTKMEDELYKYDYEDIIGDMPTRFKYRRVEKNSYGLTTEEILYARDSTLKQFVSLKKMAPYREEGEHFVGSRKRRRFREMLKSEIVEQEDSGVVGGGGGDELQPKKKKSRRLKKNKTESQHANPESTPPDTAEADEARSKKKKRSRRSKTKAESGKAEPVLATPVQDQRTKAPTDQLEEPAADVLPKKRKDTKRLKENKQRKDKSSVAGVSKSRLASYGL